VIENDKSAQGFCLTTEEGRRRPRHHSFAIVTADAASSTKQYHDRTPVVLEDSQFDEWMRGAPDQAAALMKRTSGHS
jgi:putative SOS response-associated peptidase YedK